MKRKLNAHPKTWNLRAAHMAPAEISDILEIRSKSEVCRDPGPSAESPRNARVGGCRAPVTPPPRTVLGEMGSVFLRSHVSGKFPGSLSLCSLKATRYQVRMHGEERTWLDAEWRSRETARCIANRPSTLNLRWRTAYPPTQRLRVMTRTSKGTFCIYRIESTLTRGA